MRALAAIAAGTLTLAALLTAAALHNCPCGSCPTTSRRRG